MSEIKLTINPMQEYDWLIEAAAEVATSTESDFTAMQSKKWYKHLWETISFSKDNQIRTAKGVSNLAKLQDILIKALVIVSKENTNVSEDVKKNSQLIAQLSTNDMLLQSEIMRVVCGGRDELELSDLTKKEQKLLVNLLLMAAEKNDGSNDYLTAAASAVGISIIDTSLKADAIEYLPSQQQELLYKLIMTNRYLLGIDPSAESEALDHISISPKRRNEIWNSIQETANVNTSIFFASLHNNTTYDYEVLDDCDIIFEEPCVTNEGFSQSPSKDNGYSSKGTYTTEESQQSTSDAKNKKARVGKFYGVRPGDAIRFAWMDTTFAVERKIGQLKRKRIQSSSADKDEK